MDLFLDKQQLHECETQTYVQYMLTFVYQFMLHYVALGWVKKSKDR